VADGWCWFVLREKYCWLVAGGWFVLREKYCWLVADKPSEQGVNELPFSTGNISCGNQLHMQTMKTLITTAGSSSEGEMKR
jgi:hypothetical protein